MPINGMQAVVRLQTNALLMLAMFAIALMLAAETFGGMADQAVTITMHPHVRLKGTSVRIQDLAMLSGGSESLRARISDFKIADLRSDGGSIEISQRQIDFRLRLAGIGRKLFVIRGSRISVVRRARHTPRSGPANVSSHEKDAPPVTAERVVSFEEAIFAQAKECIQRRLPWTPDDVSVELARPLGNVVKFATRDIKTLKFQSELKSSWPPLGRVHVGVRPRA